MKLYDYWRSSAAFRVRIALNLKGIAAEAVPVHLVKDGGEQHKPAYRAVNPQGLVPALEVNGQIITQSLAIIEYLEETHPNPPLLPRDPVQRAQVRAMALVVTAETHPLQNVRVLKHLKETLGRSEDEAAAWVKHWIENGMRALDGLVARSPAQGKYCFGDTVTLADVYLAPQMANVRRFKCDASSFPRLAEIDKRLMELPAFGKAAPENHPLAEK